MIIRQQTIKFQKILGKSNTMNLIAPTILEPTLEIDPKDLPFRVVEVEHFVHKYLRSISLFCLLCQDFYRFCLVVAMSMDIYIYIPLSVFF